MVLLTNLDHAIWFNQLRLLLCVSFLLPHGVVSGLSRRWKELINLHRARKIRFRAREGSASGISLALGCL